MTRNPHPPKPPPSTEKGDPQKTQKSQNRRLQKAISGAAARPTPVSDVLAIDRALERLATRDGEAAKIVELRFFAGLSIEEAAHVLDRSPATVKRGWRSARAWLFRELRLKGETAR